ncbi:hypothetical protein TNCV_1961411 [Trichonephila clavipes]|nr:hypothetical protein TNCV_1961411 [Trichonephila clavipes]
MPLTFLFWKRFVTYSILESSILGVCTSLLREMTNLGEMLLKLPSPNLVDLGDTLTEFNAEPSLWEALPEQDLTFDDYVLVDTDIAVWGALSEAEIVALDHNNTESDENESEELTLVTLSEAKVSLKNYTTFSFNVMLMQLFYRLHLF